MLKQLLKEYGKSYTPERESIYRFIEDHMPRHFDAQSLYINVSKKGDISRASIFRAVQLFENIGILRKIDYQDGHAIFELTTDTHHEHMHCSSCGVMIEFDDQKIHTLLDSITQSYGFIPSGHTIRIEGICKNCKN